MKNWKTSLLGVLATIGEYLKSQPDPTQQHAGEILFRVSILLGFWFAADHSHPALNSPSANVPPEVKSSLGTFVHILLLGAVLFIVSGCAATRTVQRMDTRATNGVTESRLTKTTTLSIWDAIAKLGGFKATQSDKTQSTTISQSDVSSSLSNVVTISGNAEGMAKLFIK
jgi:hypothetical protein